MGTYIVRTYIFIPIDFTKSTNIILILLKLSILSRFYLLFNFFTRWYYNDSYSRNTKIKEFFFLYSLISKFFFRKISITFELLLIAFEIK